MAQRLLLIKFIQSSVSKSTLVCAKDHQSKPGDSGDEKSVNLADVLQTLKIPDPNLADDQSRVSVGKSTSTNNVDPQLAMPPSTSLPISSSAASTSTTGGRFDLHVYLRQGEPVNSKFTLMYIVGNVNLVAPMVEEQVLVDSGGVKMVVRNAPRRPKLASVSVEEWCLANTRIMDKLMNSGSLCDPHSIRDYMAYTIKVCEYFRTFDKISVLQYNREYRHLQAQYGFRWGTDTPHLSRVHLKPKTRFTYVEKTFNQLQSNDRNSFQSRECHGYNSKHECVLGTTAVSVIFVV